MNTQEKIEKFVYWCNKHDLIDTDLARLMDISRDKIFDILHGYKEADSLFWDKAKKLTGIEFNEDELTYEERLESYLESCGITKKNLCEKFNLKPHSLKKVLTWGSPQHEQFLDEIEKLTRKPFRREKVDPKNDVKNIRKKFKDLDDYIYDMLRINGNTVMNEKKFKRIGGAEKVKQAVKEKWGIDVEVKISTMVYEKGSKPSKTIILEVKDER